MAGVLKIYSNYVQNFDLALRILDEVKKKDKKISNFLQVSSPPLLLSSSPPLLSFLLSISLNLILIFYNTPGNKKCARDKKFGSRFLFGHACPENSCMSISPSWETVLKRLKTPEVFKVLFRSKFGL
jgi:hypothetical protein